MADLFYKLGKKVGKSWHRGRYLYQTLTGNSEKSLQAEYALGVILARDLEKETPVSDDPVGQILADSVIRQLQKRVKNKNRYFRVKILATNDLNAFALPGGFIYITSALIQSLAKDREALAFVFAHEMVHIILKHPLKRIMTSYSLEALSRMFKTGSALGVIGKDMLKKLLHSHYSRENELAADAFGLRLMYSAGFDVQGAFRLLQLFQAQTSDNGFHYFSTHPSLTVRSHQLNDICKELGLVQKKPEAI
ncbi:hypothetical protein DRI50_01360 [candidate division KSB1 bacterium]|nr:MAG: hypothetical protein DRI50_01360 [candidate division KSB1 bacterium]